MTKKKTVSGNTPLKSLIDSIKGKNQLKPKDILRLHSKLIISFIDGTLKDDKARTLSYLCQNQIRLYELIELEKRIKSIESRFMLWTYPRD